MVFLELSVSGIDKRLSDILHHASDVEARGKRSELYMWMRKHFDEIERFLRSGQPWGVLHAAIVGEGIRDWIGKPPTLGTCQQTLTKVRKEKRLSDALRGVRKADLAAEPAVQVLQDVVPKPASVQVADPAVAVNDTGIASVMGRGFEQDRPRPTFKPATFRDGGSLLDRPKPSEPVE